jgi:hypothetical protein
MIVKKSLFTLGVYGYIILLKSGYNTLHSKDYKNLNLSKPHRIFWYAYEISSSGMSNIDLVLFVIEFDF